MLKSQLGNLSVVSSCLGSQEPDGEVVLCSDPPQCIFDIFMYVFIILFDDAMQLQLIYGYELYH